MDGLWGFTFNNLYSQQSCVLIVILYVVHADFVLTFYFFFITYQETHRILYLQLQILLCYHTFQSGNTERVRTAKKLTERLR